MQERIRKVHARVANLREDHLHKVTTRLARKYSLVGAEDLNVAGMLRRSKPKPDPQKDGRFRQNNRVGKRGLSPSIADALTSGARSATWRSCSGGASWWERSASRRPRRRLRNEQQRLCRAKRTVLDIRRESWMNCGVNALRNTKQLRVSGRSKRDLFFFIVVGMGAGATLIAFAFLPRSQVAALAFPGAVWVSMLAFRLYRQFWAGPSPKSMTKATVTYLVVVAVVLIGAGVLTGTVTRNSEGWSPLAWLLGGLVFVVISSGAWAVAERATHEATSA